MSVQPSVKGVGKEFSSSLALVIVVLWSPVLTAGIEAVGEKPKDRPLWGTHSISNYLESRSYHTFALNSQLDLPFGFKIWGFTDIHGQQDGVPGRFAFDRYFMEYRLLRDLPSEWLFGLKGVGAIAEFNDFDRRGNSVFRAGLYYGTALELPWGREGKVQCRVFPVESREGHWQVSLGYGLPLTRKLALTGFADINFHAGGPDRWVIEPQLKYAITESLSGLLEFRYNGFEADASNLDGAGLAVGLELSF